MCRPQSPCQQNHVPLPDWLQTRSLTWALYVGSYTKSCLDRVSVALYHVYIFRRFEPHTRSTLDRQRSLYRSTHTSAQHRIALCAHKGHPRLRPNDRESSGKIGQRRHALTRLRALWDQAAQIADRLTQRRDIPFRPAFEDGVRVMVHARQRMHGERVHPRRRKWRFPHNLMQPLTAAPRLEHAPQAQRRCKEAGAPAASSLRRVWRGT